MSNLTKNPRLKRLPLYTKINMLTLIEHEPFSGGRQRVKVKCDCGTIKTVDNVRFKSGIIKSCGCFIHTVDKKEYYGKRNRLESGESLKNKVIDYYKRNAKNAALDFSLTKEQMEEMFSKECFYCGDPPSKILSGKNHYGTFTYNGIDRLDPTEGYVYYNCVTCCSRCNYMKNAYTMEDFIDLVRKINENTKDMIYN